MCTSLLAAPENPLLVASSGEKSSGGSKGGIEAAVETVVVGEFFLGDFTLILATSEQGMQMFIEQL